MLLIVQVKDMVVVNLGLNVKCGCIIPPSKNNGRKKSRNFSISYILGEWLEMKGAQLNVDRGLACRKHVCQL